MLEHTVVIVSTYLTSHRHWPWCNICHQTQTSCHESALLGISLCTCVCRHVAGRCLYTHPMQWVCRICWETCSSWNSYLKVQAMEMYFKLHPLGDGNSYGVCVTFQNPLPYFALQICWATLTSDTSSAVHEDIFVCKYIHVLVYVVRPIAELAKVWLQCPFKLTLQQQKQWLLVQSNSVFFLACHFQVSFSKCLQWCSVQNRVSQHAQIRTESIKFPPKVRPQGGVHPPPLFTYQGWY